VKHVFVQKGAEATAEEVAAALAAVSMVLAEEEQAAAEVLAAPQSGWVEAARLTTQGLTPWRTPTATRWSTIERIRRAGRGSGGITGT
jgi:hypothetical protein